MRILKSFRKKTNGTAAVEFALILPILVVVLMGFVNYGFILIKSNKLNSVISAGILYSIHSSSDLSVVVDKMRASTDISPLTITTDQSCECSGGIAISCTNLCSGSVAPTQFLTFNVASSVQTLPYLLPFLANPYPITGSATIRVN